jgi:hypothetical protein
VSLASISRSSHHPSLFDSNFLSSSFISHSSTKHSFCVSLPLLRVASPQMEALVSSSSVSLTSRSTESMELESLDSPRAHTPARSVIHSISHSVNATPDLSCLCESVNSGISSTFQSSTTILSFHFYIALNMKRSPIINSLPLHSVLSLGVASVALF